MRRLAELLRKMQANQQHAVGTFIVVRDITTACLDRTRLGSSL